MKNLCAKIGEFGRFAECRFLYQACIRHNRRIRRQDAVHIGPDLDFRDAQCCAQNCGGVIRAAAAEGSCDALLRLPDKSLRNDDRALENQRKQHAAGFLRNAFEEGRRMRKLGVGDHNIARIDEFTTDTPLLQSIM